MNQSEASITLLSESDTVTLSNKLLDISTLASSVSSISSDSDYDSAYDIRSRIKSAIKWIKARTRPRIESLHRQHKEAVQQEKDYISTLTLLDNDLDVQMKEYNYRKRESARELSESINLELLSIAGSILEEDGRGSEEGSNGNESIPPEPLSLPQLPEIILDKSRGETVKKKVKINDVTKFKREFIDWFLLDAGIQESLRKWLESEQKNLGGFKQLEMLAGEGSIIEIEVDSVRIT